ncbi:hypothetical protein Lebu_0532 [Leptotrichia buccalis C-1013-b]|jgi:hypothetical protein|uniref:Uncharacterized protein n=2 Tax=Leptotrichia buccalis TaxID=40542 RepID=C7NET2_LEPBD|nr:hypothetical protein Lebu_0532 [Leptotrichia buccalis C-1013-b]
MRKLKYTLLFVMLIFGLNSCLTTMVGWGICEQYGCTPSPKKNGIEGVEIFAKENFLEFKSYFESLKKRETVMVKAGNNETFNVNLPKSFILKKIKDGYYLYDEEKKIGFFVIEDLRVSQSYDKRDIEKIFNGSDRKDYKIINVNKDVQTLKDKKGLILKLKKFSENYYALASFYESDEHSKEIQEIYDYLLEKM